MDIPAFSAAVLTGGESRRMGTDKALIELSGMTVLERVTGVLRQVADDVLVVGERPEYRSAGVPVVPDDVPGMGPLGGIATALRHATHDLVFITACDMPLLDADLIRAMAAEYDGRDALVLSRSRDGQSTAIEPMHAFYAVSGLEVIEEQLDRRQLRLEDALTRMNPRVLPESWLLEHDPLQDTLFNMNRPEDVAYARERLKVREG